MEPSQWPGTLRELDAFYSPQHHNSGRRAPRAHSTGPGGGGGGSFSRAHASPGSPSSHQRRAASGSRRRATHEDRLRPHWNPSTRLGRPTASDGGGGDPLYALLDNNLRRAGFDDDYDDAVARFLARRRAARVRQIAEEEYQEAAAVWWYCTQVMPAEQRAALEEDERACRHALADDEWSIRRRLQFLFAEATDALLRELWALEAAERAAAEHAALVAEREDEEARERFVRKAAHLNLAEEELRGQLLEHAETESFRIETTCLEERVEVAECELRRVRHMVDEQTALIRHEERCRAIICGAYDSQLDELLVVTEADRTALSRHLLRRLEEEEAHRRDGTTKAFATSWASVLERFGQVCAEYAGRQTLIDTERGGRVAIVDDEVEALALVWRSERQGACAVIDAEEIGMRCTVAAAEQRAREPVVVEAARWFLYVHWLELRLNIVTTEAEAFHDLNEVMLAEERSARTSVVVKQFTARCSRDVLAMQQSHQRDLLDIYEAATRDRLQLDSVVSWAFILRSMLEHRGLVAARVAMAGVEAAEAEARRRDEAEEEVERASLTGVRDADRSRLVRVALQDVVLTEEFDRADIVAADEYFWRFIARMAEILVLEEEQRAEGRVVEGASRQAIATQSSLSRQTAMTAAEARARADLEATSLNQLNAVYQRCTAGADDLRAQLVERQRQAQLKRQKAALASPKKFIGITAVERVKERCLQIEAMHVGGPAHAAGAQLNDVVAKVGGIPVTTRDDMRRAIASTGKMNEDLLVTLRRLPPPADSEDTSGSAAAKSTAAAALSSGEEVQLPVRVMCTDREFSDVEFFFDPATPKVSILDPR